MKKVLFTLLLIFNLQFIICNSLYTQWLQQTSGVTTPLYNIEFVNSLTGWVTGNSSRILKTTNGGVNWFEQTINLTYSKNLYGLDMIDANTGYIAGWFETILKTTNGGTNWTIISNIPSNDGNSNHATSFINALTGWVCSSLGRVLRTTNGGISWDTANVGSGGPLRDIQFVNSQTGFVCGDVGLLKRSTNGGINWSASVLPTTSNLPSLHFINQSTGWVVSEQQNEVFRTTNGGIKWDTMAIIPGGTNLYSYSIYFSSYSTGYVGGTVGRLFKTTNSGTNWYQQNVTFPMFVGNFSFVNDSTGWCVGGGGGILRTTNGGTYVTVENITSEIPSEFKLYQNYPNPFNSQTTIKFEIDKQAYYKLKVFDVLGKEVDVLLNENLNPGIYKQSYNAEKLSSGVYFYRLISNEVVIDTKKMVLVK